MDKLTQTHRRTCSVLLIALLLSFNCLAVGLDATNSSIQLPELGSPSDQYLTPAEEIRLGKAFMRNIRKTQSIISDPLIEEYVQQLGNRLLKNSDATGQDFNFFVIEEPMINAFAGPGGHIGIFSGLILATQSESELASVLAHEIAHVTQKHLLRAFDTASQMSGTTAALMLAAILLGAATSSPDVGVAIASGAQANALQEQINFTRSNEQEADHVGMQILSKAEFDPRAMPVFFERLTHANRLFDSGIPEILRTHPVTTNRIADALGRADAYGYKQYEGSFRYYLVREALRASQFTSPQDAVKHFKSGLKEGRHLNREAHEYGYALSLTANRQYGEAEKVIDRLLGKRPAQVEYILAKARLSDQAGKGQEALETLTLANSLLPHDYPLAVATIEALLKNDKAEQAKKICANFLSLRTDDARLYRLLGEAEQKMGREAEAHRLLAEAYVIEDKIEAAVLQLETAKSHQQGDDFYLTSQIESRLEELKRRVARNKRDPR
jgi:predicted Zn-dependent protease